MRKIRIAQIGMNFYSHGDMAAAGFIKSDRFEFVGYCLPEGERDKFPHRLTELAGQPELTLEAILCDPTIEAVAVETDEIYLTKYALMAAKAGKHVYMEKPGSADHEAFTQLVRILRDNRKVFHLGYMYRYNPAIMELMTRIRNGELGEILNVEAQMNCTHPLEARRWMEQMPGGMMFFLGCHLIDLILQIQGEPLAVHAFCRSSGLDGVSALDSGFAVLEYPSGVSFAKTNNVEHGGYMRRQLVVTGSKETVVIEPLERALGPGRLVSDVTCSRERDWHKPPIVSRSVEYARYGAMIDAFADEVLGLRENPYSYEYELKLHKLVLQACGL